MKKEYILHIDTSGALGVVMISARGEVKAVEKNETEREHAGTVNAMINGVLAKANVPIEALAAVAVCSGPGSYTGLRIGLATAKGLCYALDIPLILHDRLQLMAGNAHEKVMLSILPARAGEYFMAVYGAGGEPLLPPQHAETQEVLRLVNALQVQQLTGEAGEDITNVLPLSAGQHSSDVQLPFWASVAQERFDNKQFENIATAEPLYLKSVYIHKKSS